MISNVMQMIIDVAKICCIIICVIAVLYALVCAVRHGKRERKY